MSIPISDVASISQTTSGISQSGSSSSAGAGASWLNTFVNLIKTQYVTFILVFVVLWLSQHTPTHVILDRIPNALLNFGDPIIISMVYLLLFIALDFAASTFLHK